MTDAMILWAIVAGVFMGVSAGSAIWLCRGAAGLLPVRIRVDIEPESGLWFWHLYTTGGHWLASSNHGFVQKRAAHRAVRIHAERMEL